MGESLMLILNRFFAYLGIVKLSPTEGKTTKSGV